MTPELQKYYEDRLAMMGGDAWQEFMEDVQKMLASTNKLDGVNDEKVLFFKKGEISIMNWLLAQKDMTREAYEELKNES